MKAFRRAVRMGNWKAVRYNNKGKTELYNLKDDLYEKNDVALKFPEIVDRMGKIMVKESSKNEHSPNSGKAME